MNITILDETRNTVRDIFAEVTRYPLDILDPAASLEEDLGIDSVKLGEIFSVLREKYDLPKEINIPAEKLRTISGISEALQEYLVGRNHANRTESPDGSQTTAQATTIVAPAPSSVRNVASTPGGELSNGVVDESFARLTAAQKPF